VGNTATDAGNGTGKLPVAVWYAAVVAVALVIRAVYLAELWDSALFAVALGDGRQYLAWAREIAAGDWLGSEVFYQAPLYPYLLALVIRLCGDSLGTLRILQAAFGAASCGLLAAAGRRFFSLRVGVIAGLLLAVYPPAVFFDGILQKTSVGLALMCLALALAGSLAAARGDMRPGIVASLGVTLGLLCLVRENALLLPPVLAVWVGTLRPADDRRAWRGVAVLLSGVALVLIPVTVRNLLIGGQFALTTAQLGPNFYIGNHADADGRYRPLVAGREDARVERSDARTIAAAELGYQPTAGEVSRYWVRRALRDVASSPGRWLGLELRKALLAVNRREIVDTESIEAYRRQSRLLAALGCLHFGIIGPLAAIGCWLTRRQWQRLWVLYAVAASIVASLVVFYVMARYRFPLVPLAAMFASAGICGVAELVQQRAWRRLAGCLVVVGAAALLCNWPLELPTEPLGTTYYNLGVALHEAGDDRRALECLEKARAEIPEAAVVHDRLGRVELALGRPAQAVEHFRRAIELRPDDLDARRRLAAALTAAGRTREAAEVLRGVVAVEPASVDDRTRLGHLLLTIGDLDDAEVQLRRAVETGPRAALARDLLANIFAERGELAPARTLYEEALAIDPQLTDAHFKLGMLHADAGRLEEARAEFEAVVRLLPDFAEAHVRLAEVLERTGDLAAAGEAYRRVLELRPADEAARRGLARLGAEPVIR